MTYANNSKPNLRENLKGLAPRLRHPPLNWLETANGETSFYHLAKFDCKRNSPHFVQIPETRADDLIFNSRFA